MPSLYCNDKKIEYSIVRRKRKTVGITISPEKKIQVAAPKWVTNNQIQDIIKEKSSWIFNKLLFLEQTGSEYVQRQFITGESYLYIGETFVLEILENNAIKSGTVIFNEGKLFIYVHSGMSADNMALLVKKSLTAWYRAQALIYINERILIYSKVMNLKPSKTTIKEQKKRWGSCTSDNKLNMNWKLIMAPTPIIDYVVVHELAHIKIKDHSQTFWRYVETIIPEYKTHRKWLKTNGHILYV
jgi:predicted metal-dependent hydrolase